MRFGKLFVIMAILVSGCDGGGRNEPADSPAAALPSASPAHETPAPTGDSQASDSPQYVVVMLGDSLTAGFGLAPADALPEQVEALLLEASPEIDVINAGVSGDTSAGGLARYDWSVGSAKPDLLVIVLGANDYLNGVDPERTRTNIAAIIERAQSSRIDILLVSVSPRSSAEDDPKAAEFAAIFRELATTYDVGLYEGLVDKIQDRPELLLQDGLHPTAEGVKVIAAPLAEAITHYIPQR
ncbi:MAG: arylesterase [Alphaproteobacteria bacterium]|nr:arylesterase [Alphaproteobacteria bacterium]MBU2085122.1 arylesterase [Alphaproteobacteria bacterium]MBU2142052.1 arylesterase [Alphaproteobacteria bacterium]MBU2196944.1 arylesterase [Alphaproteobacteria bacterium]